MPPHIVNGRLEDLLQHLDADDFDAVLCDPPYGFRFMGKRWDYDVPSATLWEQIVRVLKPGAPVLAFGGTRTYHRLVCAMEDGGLEIRDTIAWLYGSGFPKSLDVSKALDKQSGIWRGKAGPVISENPAMTGANYSRTEKGHPVTAAAAAEWSGYGTALKPALEPICVARKPLEGTMAENVGAHGVGGLNIDGTRIETTDKYSYPNGAGGNSFSVGQSPDGSRKTPVDSNPLGRWPANVIMDEAAGQVLDAQSGGASRFFYCAKANRKEREAGLESAGLPARAGYEAVEREADTAGVQNPRAGAGRTAGQVRNFHPTVKPLDLCRYLATLIKPPKPGKILVPFAGSGSEIIGCILAGWEDVLGIEQDKTYCDIANARIAHWRNK